MGKNKKIASLLVLFAVVLFGLNVPVLKELMPRYMLPIDATILRAVGGAFLFWVASIFTPKEHPSLKETALLIVVGCSGMLPFLYFYNLAINVGSPIDVSLMLSLAPLLVAVVSAIKHRSMPKNRKLWGLLFTMSGALLIILMSESDSNKGAEIGILYAFIAISFYSGFLIGIEKLSQKYLPITLLKWSFLAASIVVLPIGLNHFLHSNLIRYMQSEAVWLSLFVVVFPTFLAILIIPYGVKKLGVEIVPLYQNVTPLVASIVAIIVGQASLRWDQPVAGVIMFIGIYLSSTKAKKLF